MFVVIAYLSFRRCSRKHSFNTEVFTRLDSLLLKFSMTTVFCPRPVIFTELSLRLLFARKACSCHSFVLNSHVSGTLQRVPVLKSY